MSKYEKIDPAGITLSPIEKRQNLVKIADFAKPIPHGAGFVAFLESLPSISHRTDAASNLRQLVIALQQAVARKNSIIWGIGPHVIKYGLSLLISDLMDQGFISAIALNGAGAIHDTEMALIGETSEEMGGRIGRGEFGMARETGEFLNGAAALARQEEMGFGEALGQRLCAQNAPYLDYSIIAQAYRRDIPVTIHVAIGTDIIHMHPSMNGADTGYASLQDFYTLARVVSRLNDGGIYLNIGSSVVLPEVFLKSLTMANNLYGEVKNFLTVNIDHLSEYRPLMNVVRRPTIESSQGFELIGRIELLIPILAALLKQDYTFDEAL